MKEKSKKMKLKEAKGITLVALVVTIVILIILATVSINTIFNKNGIIKKAQEAKQLAEKSVVIESIEMDILAEEMNSNGTITRSKLCEIIKKYDKDEKIRTNENGENYIITDQNYQIDVNKYIGNQTEIEDAMLLIQTAEGALSDIHEKLQRMKELGMNAGNETNNSQDRENIQEENSQLINEITNISNTTQFGSITLLDGTLSYTINIGYNGEIIISIENMSATNLGVQDINFATENIDEIEQGIEKIDKAIQKVSEERNKIGNILNTLDEINN